MVALMSAGGLAACGNNETGKAKTPVAQTTAVPLENVSTIADVTPGGKSDRPVAGDGSRRRPDSRWCWVRAKTDSSSAR